MKTNPILTTTIYFNRCPAVPRVVVAKKVKGWDEPYPVTYANLTQAYRKSGELNLAGIKATVIGQRPYYVQIGGMEA